MLVHKRCEIFHRFGRRNLPESATPLRVMLGCSSINVPTATGPPSGVSNPEFTLLFSTNASLGCYELLLLEVGTLERKQLRAVK